MPAKAKLSAVDLAKLAAEERLIAYRDHMDAAHAADREATASQALLDVEQQISRLSEEVQSDKLNVGELKGVVKEARFDAEEVKARSKFTTKGPMAKLKFQSINENNEVQVSKEEQELISARKKLKLSETALNQLKNGEVLQNAQRREKQALSDLALADAHARIAATKLMHARER